MNACRTASDTCGIVLAAAAEIPLEEVIHQHRDVLAPLAQRRQRDRQHVQAVEQVFAELAVVPPSAADRAWCRR